MASTALATRETKAARTRRRILDAAAVEFAERGYAETSLRRIATASELKLGSLYFHFESKDLLAAEVLSEGIEIALAQISGALDALDPAASAGRRVAAAIYAHIHALHGAGAKGAAVVRMIETFPDQVRAAQSPLLRRYARRWTRLITDAQDENAIDPDLDPRVVRELLVAAMNGTLSMNGTPGTVASTLARLTLNPPTSERDGT